MAPTIKNHPAQKVIRVEAEQPGIRENLGVRMRGHVAQMLNTRMMLTLRPRRRGGTLLTDIWPLHPFWGFKISLSKHERRRPLLGVLLPWERSVAWRWGPESATALPPLPGARAGLKAALKEEEWEPVCGLKAPVWEARRANQLCFFRMYRLRPCAFLALRSYGC